MPSAKNSSHKRRRNNPYILDDMFMTVHRTAAGVVWRMRTEILALIAGAAAFTWLDMTSSVVWACIIVVAAVTPIFVLPWTRRFIIRKAWCVISRHRMQRVFFETRMHTRSGRLPLILRIHPTEVGERALVWCRAGICFEDFEAHIGEIAAACYGREARVERSKRWSHIVVINVVRRDTLAASNIVVSRLAPKFLVAAKEIANGSRAWPRWASPYPILKQAISRWRSSSEN